MSCASSDFLSFSSVMQWLGMATDNCQVVQCYDLSQHLLLYSNLYCRVSMAETLRLLKAMQLVAAVLVL